MNLKTKTNTVKQILARVMIVVLLVASMLSLSACWGNYRTMRYEQYYSHSEFVEFIEKYNSKNDGFASTFISFDFDSNDIVLDKCYHWGALLNLNKYIDTIFDKYQDKIGVGMYFYINDNLSKDGMKENTHQIFCAYSSNQIEYNYDEKAEFVLKKCDDTTKQPNYLNEVNSIYFYNPKQLEYNYIQTYWLTINGIEFMEISIASLEKELSQEKLDEICKLLMDNIVIINTEG